MLVFFYFSWFILAKIIRICYSKTNFMKNILGFTLIELCFSLLIFSVGLLGFMTLLQKTAHIHTDVLHESQTLMLTLALQTVSDSASIFPRSVSPSSLAQSLQTLLTTYSWQGLQKPSLKPETSHTILLIPCKTCPSHPIVI